MHVQTRHWLGCDPVALAVLAMRNFRHVQTELLPVAPGEDTLRVRITVGFDIAR
jgi:hypothetical protein